MVSGPIFPQGRFWDPKAPISLQITHFHEMGGIHQKCNFHDIPPFWGEMAQTGRSDLNGYLLKHKHIAQFGVLRLRAAKVRFCASKSPSCEKASFLLQRHFLAKRSLWRPKVDCG